MGVVIQKRGTRRHRGFTLLEVLMVITIVGVMVGVVVVSFGAIDQRHLHAEADRLLLALNQAADYSLMQQETIGWFYDKELNIYAFKQLSEDGSWAELTQPLFAPHDIETEIKLVMGEDNPVIEQTNTKKPDEQTIPDVLFLSSGEYTPFLISISSIAKSKPASLPDIKGDGFSNIRFITL